MRNRQPNPITVKDSADSKTENKFLMTNFAKEALHDLVHFDNKFLTTVKPVILKPGFLTLETLNGRQANYMKPLALFVFLNFIFFIFKSRGLFQYTIEGYQSIPYFKGMIQSGISSTHLSFPLFKERFDTAMNLEQKEYLIIMVPLFALALKVLYLRKGLSYMEHLIFTLHFYSFVLIFLMVVPFFTRSAQWIIDLLGGPSRLLYTEMALTIILFLIISVYLFAALKKVYKEKVWLTLFKSLITTFCFLGLIAFVYRYILFFVVFHSIKE